jgi:repressor LexA
MGKRSERELQILEFMRSEIQKKGYPPTVREVCAALGIRSTSTVHKALLSLEEQGLIRKDPTKRRAIEVLAGSTNDQPVRRKNAKTKAIEEDCGADVAPIPVVGRIAAGTPVLAQENIEDYIPVPSRFLGNGTNIMLVVKGDSMIEAGIFDGDYLLVQMKNSAENGDIVVAMIEGIESEATVKTFYKEKDRIRLQPENSSMDPIYVKEVSILGLVKGVFRYLS